jgi:hypothetical protein
LGKERFRTLEKRSQFARDASYVDERMSIV